MKKHNYAKGKSLMPSVLGLGAAVLFSLLGTAIMGKLMLAGIAENTITGIGINIIRFLAVVVGGITACLTGGKENWLPPIVCGLYFLVIVLVGLLIPGTYGKVYAAMVSVAAGGVCTCLFCLKKQKRNSGRKRRYR